jgi:hypothetical protein
MAIPPPDKPESRGLTILGTTLTRRQTAIAAAIVLALLLLLVLVVPKAFGDDPDDNNAGNTPAAKPPAASTTAEDPATSAPAAPPAASAKPSAAPTSKAPAASDIPKGWYRYTDSTGFSVPLPNGWTADRRGSEVYFQGKGRLLIIDQTKSPKPDPVKDWKNQESERRGTVYRNYKPIRLEAVDYFQKAADWEFTYTTRGGNAQHAQKRGFIVGPKQAYGISWYTSPDEWNGAKSALEIIYKGFKPAKG